MFLWRRIAETPGSAAVVPAEPTPWLRSVSELDILRPPLAGNPCQHSREYAPAKDVEVSRERNEPSGVSMSMWKNVAAGFVLGVLAASGATAWADHRHDPDCDHPKEKPPSPGGCNAYGCFDAGGGCNAYGCWRNEGGCNAYGCWSSPAGACNAYGCSEIGACTAYGCPKAGARPTRTVRGEIACTKYGYSVPNTPAGCNAYGCFDAAGGCNAYGCWKDGGGCNAYGCWSSPAGVCNAYGCAEVGTCSAYGCPRRPEPEAVSCRELF